MAETDPPLGTPAGLPRRYDQRMTETEEPRADALPASRPRWFLPAVVVAAVLAAGIGVTFSVITAGAVLAPHTFSADGFVVISNTTCDSIPDGFSDIAPGVDVNVKDQSGKLVAFGELRKGKDIGGAIDSCAFPFKVTDIPSGLGIYSVEVSHRGAIQYKEPRMRKDGIVMGLSAP